MRKNGTNLDKLPDKAKKFGRRYPWEEWFALPVFYLIRGQDYSCMPHGMAQMVRNNAAQRRVKVHVEIAESGNIKVTMGGTNA